MTSSTTPALPSPGENLDRLAHAQMAQLTAGISPVALRLAYDDWLTHLAQNPAQQAELALNSAQMLRQFAAYALQAVNPSRLPGAEPIPGDSRFRNPAWQAWPFNVISQGFLLTEKCCQDATTGLRGVSQHHEEVVSFTTRQLLDIVSPSNFVWTNPEVLERTEATTWTSISG